MAMEWTDELIARLKELWGQGHSTAEIGRQLSITKNAVVGKAHRLGLPPRPSPIRNKAAAEAVSKPARPRAARTKKTVAAGEEAEAKPVDASPASPAEKTGKKAAPKAAAAEMVEPSGKAGASREKQADPAAEAPAKAAAPRKESRSAAAPSGQESATAPQEAPARPAAPPRKVAPPRRVREAMDRPARQGPTCQWPIGDPGTPEFHFCGGQALPGKPYCAEHAAVAYVKIRDRRH